MQWVSVTEKFSQRFIFILVNLKRRPEHTNNGCDESADYLNEFMRFVFPHHLCFLLLCLFRWPLSMHRVALARYINSNLWNEKWEMCLVYDLMFRNRQAYRKKWQLRLPYLKISNLICWDTWFCFRTFTVWNADAHTHTLEYTKIRRIGQWSVFGVFVHLRWRF